MRKLLRLGMVVVGAEAFALAHNLPKTSEFFLYLMGSLIVIYTSRKWIDDGK